MRRKRHERKENIRVLLDPVAVSLLKLKLKPLHGGFRSGKAVTRYETVSEVERLQIYNGYM
jgi:hypothetical protein